MFRHNIKKSKQANLQTNEDLNTVSQIAAKNKEKIEKLQMFDLSLFIGNNYLIKAAAADMRYSTRSKFIGSSVHKKKTFYFI